MGDPGRFRSEVRARLRAAGRTQRQLARAVGLHPDVLSHKLNGTDGSVLAIPEVTGIVTVLAGWGALASRAEAGRLLELMAVPPHAIPAGAWASAPLAALRPDGAGPEGPGGAGSQWPGPDGPRRLVLAPLPAPVTALIGRERELAGVAAALAVSRLVTLTGTAGTGKTRLALAAAAGLAGRFAGGVAFAGLAAVADPALLGTAIAAAVGLSPPSAAAAEGQLAGALAGRELLLVLDNLEQLAEEAPLLARLLAAAPGLRILATSRIALRLSGEHTLRVPPLGLPGDGPAGDAAGSEAVRLFLARAQAVRPGVGRGDGELAAVAGICVALDGLPLAIELAAARVGLYSPQALLPLLGSRLALLTGGPRDLPGRQQTLHAALDWSYQLLDAAGRQLFGCLGVFAGSFDAAAAAAVSGGGDPAVVVEQLAGLAGHSMLEVIPGDPPRFRLLQTVSEYATARLAEAGQQEEVRRRHLGYYLALAEEARVSFSGPGQPRLLEVLAGSQPDIRAALEFAAARGGQDGGILDQGLRLAAAAGLLWRRRGPLAEGDLQFTRLLAVPGRPAAASRAVRAAAVLEACTLACLSGQYPRAGELSRHALELCAALGDDQGQIRARCLAGETAIATGDFSRAAPHLEQALAGARRAGALIDQAAAANMAGQLDRYLGRPVQAGRLLREAVRLFRDAGEPDGAASALHSLAEAERDAGHLPLARRLYARALRQHHASGNKHGTAYDLEGLAVIAGHDGDIRQALVYLGAAQLLREEAGAPLPPADRAILTRILGPAVAALPPGPRHQAVAWGRSQPLPGIIARALGQPPPPAPG